MVYKYILGQQGGTVVSTVASKQESPGFLEFAYYPPCVCVVSLWGLQLPPTVQRVAVSGVRLSGLNCP